MQVDGLHCDVLINSYNRNALATGDHIKRSEIDFYHFLLFHLFSYCNGGAALKRSFTKSNNNHFYLFFFNLIFCCVNISRKISKTSPSRQGLCMFVWK